MFVKHTECKRCGSSDANALYDDGGTFCWSCRASQRATQSPYLIDKPVSESSYAVPEDSSYHYPPHVMQWIGKYGLTALELMKHNVVYSQQRDQLIYTWLDGGGNVILWQGRNFNRHAKSKCYTKGVPNEVLPWYEGKGTINCFVLVEDPVSAMKVARHCKGSMTCLGSDLPSDKLKRLASSLGPFLGLVVPVVVWLDGNMFHKAQKMVERLKMLGIEASCVYTKEDPKELSDTEIKKVLDKAL